MVQLKFISDPSPAKDFFAVAQTKDLLTLHFTAGYSINSANSTLDRIDQVAVAYIVDVNGDIYHKFDKKFWAYHLGMKSHNQGHIQDKRSIGIEIVNIGPVWLKNGQWYDYVGRKHPVANVVPGNDRGANGSVKFPKVQMDAVCGLVNALCDKVPTIPRLVPKDKLSCQIPALAKFKGIISHQMFRKDKYDMGVAFDWPRLIKACGLKEV